MALFRSIGARKDATRGTAAIEVRKDLAGLVTGAGVLPGSTSPLVTGSAGWAYTVKAARWVTSRGASDGVHLWGNDGDITVGSSGVGGTVTAAPGAGLSRIDIIYAFHPSASENSDTTSAPTVAVAVGTAASTPLAPSIPTGALELARNTMTSSATTTASAGNTITQSAARAYMIGSGPLPVYSSRRGTTTTHVALSWTSVLTLAFDADSPAGVYLLDARFTYSGNAVAAIMTGKIVDGTTEGSAAILGSDHSLNAQSGVSTSASTHTTYTHAGGAKTISMWLHGSNNYAVGAASMRAVLYSRTV